MRSIRAALLRWYRRNKRDLPWRNTRDPYAIWISETMLQQTRVETVIPYYERFLASFPDVQSLASADADDVMQLWAGLGYYSRARNLQHAARQVVEEHGGSLPDEVAALRGLRGIGRYTAGAVASIAFDRPEPVVDGNVARVLSRLLGLREDITQPAVQRRLWDAAGELARGPSPGDLNQALMELGATLCTPKSPRCDACPLRRRCDAHAAGDATSLPVKPKRPRARRVRGACAVLSRGGRWLAVRRPPEGLLGGLWELPGGEIGAREAAALGLVRQLRERLGLEVHSLEPAGRVKHRFTHRELELRVFRGEADPGRVRRSGFDAHRWVSRSALAELPMSTVMRRALRAAE